MDVQSPTDDHGPSLIEIEKSNYFVLAALGTKTADPSHQREGCHENNNLKWVRK